MMDRVSSIIVSGWSPRDASFAELQKLGGLNGTNTKYAAALAATNSRVIRSTHCYIQSGDSLSRQGRFASIPLDAWLKSLKEKR